MDLAFAFSALDTKGWFVLPKIQTTAVLRLSCVSCFSWLSLLVWIVLPFVVIIFFLYKINVLGELLSWFFFLCL